MHPEEHTNYSTSLTLRPAYAWVPGLQLLCGVVVCMLVTRPPPKAYRRTPQSKFKTGAHVAAYGKIAIFFYCADITNPGIKSAGSRSARDF